MTTHPIRIAPSILSADLAYLAEDVLAVEQSGADWLHVDVMDGRFVPNLTFGMPLVKSLRHVTQLPLDVHLMIVEPERYIEAFAAAGADHITVHAEACPHLERTLAQIQETGCKAGVALNPSTPLSVLDYVYHRLDLVLIMTVNPGFGGQSFIKATLPKIEQLSEKLADNNPNTIIAVDGGVSPITVGEIAKAGATALVAGNAIFSAPKEEYAEKILAIRQVAQAAKTN
ncbi:MAG: ribulose-phosphate 3-epimerase [Myxococcales bacterium]|nr:ribulose-phosphate 3-epimerase [Myxococcales bacterium]MCB9644799.1 ribulose-phosphate 3-epimerase [Myxococcales bacterium]